MSSNSTVPAALASTITVGHTIVFLSGTLSLMYAVYGFYILLFGSYLYMMRSRRPSETVDTSLYMALTIALFALSTIFVMEYTVNLVHFSTRAFTAVMTGDFGPVVRPSAEKTIIYILNYLIPILLNVMAECMFIHRCYIIWDSDKRVAIPLILVSVLINGAFPDFCSDTICTYSMDGSGLAIAGLVMRSIDVSQKTGKEALYNAGMTISFSYNIASATNNLGLTLLTAGRIWWIHRQIVRDHGVLFSDRFVWAVSRLILESGLLYPLFSVAALLVNNLSTTNKMPFDIFVLATLSAGIAPTLILVRAKLGKNIESVRQAVSEIRFDSRPIRQTRNASPQALVCSIDTIAQESVQDETKGEDRV